MKVAARRIGLFAVACLLVVWLGGGSCSVAYTSCTSTDPNHPCGKPHGGTAVIVASTAPDAFRIRSFVYVLGDEEPHAPLRRLAILDGPDLVHAFGEGPYDVGDFVELTSRVRARHPELFAVSDDATGTLVLRSVDVGSSTVVRWGRSARDGTPIEGAELAFLFRGSRLIEIDDAIRSRTPWAVFTQGRTR